MAATRCTSCQLPMTESEAKAGKCPVCKKKLTQAEAVAANVERKLGFFARFAILCGFALLGVIVEAVLTSGRGNPTFGVAGGIGLGTGILQSLGYMASKKK